MHFNYLDADEIAESAGPTDSAGGRREAGSSAPQQKSRLIYLHDIRRSEVLRRLGLVHWHMRRESHCREPKERAHAYEENLRELKGP